MLLLLRRFLVVVALLFWQGGFTFYAAVVVPVGQHVHGHLRQGFVTQQVTDYLNLAGAAGLAVLICDQLAARDPSAARRWMRWLLWGGMIAGLALLFGLHARMDELLQADGMIVLDRQMFRPRHRIYLWISTLQWACGLLYLWLMLAAWRAEDRPAAREVAALAARGHERAAAAADREETKVVVGE